MSENALPRVKRWLPHLWGRGSQGVSIRCRTVAVQPLSPHDMAIRPPGLAMRDRGLLRGGYEGGTSGGLMRGPHVEESLHDLPTHRPEVVMVAPRGRRVFAKGGVFDLAILGEAGSS